MNKAVHLIPHKDVYVVYAPLVRRAAFINQAAGQRILALGEGWQEKLPAAEPALFNDLESQGLFASAESSRPVCRSTSIAPTTIALQITSACTLRCTYCFADAGGASTDMPFWIAAHAVDFAVSNAIESGKDAIRVQFFGEGEPTARFPLLKSIVEYAQQKASENRLNCLFVLTSNCLMSERTVDYLSQHKFSVSASVDGTQRIQDQNRPLANGEGTWKRAYRTLKRFDAVGIRYSIRSTVVPGSEKDMADFVELVANELSAKRVQFEPVHAMGRAATASTCDVATFCDEFERARRIGMSRGIEVAYSGCSLGRTCERFCKAYGDTLNFVVSVNGAISSCYERVAPDESEAGMFVYGRVVSEGNTRIVLDDTRVRELQKIAAGDHLPCETCFARWDCGGECLSRLFACTGSLSKSQDSYYRCGINRRVVLDGLENMLWRNVEG